MTTKSTDHVCGHHDTNPKVPEAVAAAGEFCAQFDGSFPSDPDAKSHIRLLVAAARREGATWDVLATKCSSDPETLRNYVGCIPRFGKKKPDSERRLGAGTGNGRRHLREHANNEEHAYDASHSCCGRQRRRKRRCRHGAAEQ